MRDNLWAPWRMSYIRGLAGEDTPQPTDSICFLCDAAKHGPDTTDGRDRLVLVNDARGVILLNRYPYTSGHLLIAAAEHQADLTDLSPDERAGLMELTVLAEQLVRAAANPQGINIGINLGRCAGAGLPGHLHIHVVPRWSGDTNFMEVVGRVRVIPQALEETYETLRETLTKMNNTKT